MNIPLQKLFKYLALFGFFVNYLTYSPGFMSPDSIDQYNQALANVYTSWHPPVMAGFWHVLNILHRGPELMLVFQLGLLWYSYYFLAIAFQKKKAGVILFLFFFLAPFLQNFSGYIIKDVQMALSWFCAIALLFRYAISKEEMPKSAIIISALLLAYGTWVRHNAPAGVLTLCFVWAWIVFPQKRIKSRVFIATAFFLSILVSHKIVLKLINAYKTYPETVLYMHDLTAMFVKTGENVFPAELYNNPDFDTAYLRAKFHPAIYDHILWNPDNKKLVTLDSTTASLLKPAWIKAIKDHPGTYLSNRFETFLYFLRIHEYSDLQHYFPWIHPNDYGFVVKEDRFLYKIYTQYIGGQKGLFYFQTWFWLLLTIVLACITPVLKNKQYAFIYLCLLASSFLYFMPQFLLSSTDKDFRYIYWCCIACTLAVVLLIADNKTAKRKITSE